MDREKEFVHALLKWFKNEKRWMPWRQTKNPYDIWVSEVMLQQTRVETVIEYFQRFMEQFPDVYHLAAAEEEEVMKSWEGLGYYSRARNLHRAAKKVVEEYEGKLPKDLQSLLKLPGIGNYTAGAILSIAFNQPIPAVDGNVLRVFSRIENIHDNILDKETMIKVRNLIIDIIPQEAGDFNEALMELGAIICIPQSPRCSECPVAQFCIAYQKRLQDQLPIRVTKTKVRSYEKIVLWIEDKERILVMKNRNKGLLSGLWILPTLNVEENLDMKDKGEIESFIEKKLCIPATNTQYIGEDKHIFTHQRWKIHIFYCQPKEETEIFHNCPYEWVLKENLIELPFPTVYKKIIDRF